MSSSIRRASLSDAITFKLTNRSSLAGFLIGILVVGGALSPLPPPLDWAPGVGDGGSNYRLVGEALYISSYQHTKMKI